jgi:hypothetical protein
MLAWASRLARLRATLAAPPGVEDGHGRLGGDAGDLAPEKLIEHDVADDEDFAAAKRAENLGEARRGEMHESVKIFPGQCQSGSESLNHRHPELVEGPLAIFLDDVAERNS